MSRLGGAFWFIFVVATGMTNFLVKQTVQGLDDQLSQVRRKTVEDQRKIHDLTADWTFLNQPEHLADLNSRYVHLAPMSPKQVVTNLDGIPMRPVPPPAEPAPPAVAEFVAPVPAPVPAPASAPAPAAVAAPAPTAAQIAAASLPPSAPAPIRAIVPVPPLRVTGAPVTPLSLISTADAAPAPGATPAPRAAPAAPAAPPSLDAIFSQVVGTR